MTACAYRSLEPVLHQRVADLRRRRECDVVFVDVALRVASRRIGRALAGGTGVALGALSFLLALLSFTSNEGEHVLRVASTALLLAAGPVAIGVGALSRLLARPMISRDAHVSLSGNPAVDLARLEASDPLRAACDLVMAWERRSVALPLAALSLLAPLTLHAIVAAVLARPPLNAESMDSYGDWIGISALLVGHAHLALLVCSARWACSLRSLPTALLGDRTQRNRACGVALLVASGVACIPGLILLAIPPLLVLVTGATFVPLMYCWTTRTLVRERTALEAM